jgi:hypothetical protein
MRHYDGRPEDTGVHWAMRVDLGGNIESSWESVFDFFYPEYVLLGTLQGAHVWYKRDPLREHRHRSEQRLLRRSVAEDRIELVAKEKEA